MSEKKVALTITVLYMILILFSLGDPGMVLAVERRLLGDNVDLFSSLLPYGIIVFLLLFLIFVKKETRPGRFLFLIVISITVFFIIRFLNGEREKIHLIEFAVLGGLLYWMPLLWKYGPSIAYLCVAALGMATVALDELIQYSLALKVFSLRDVLINVMSVWLGAVIYAGLFSSPFPQDGEETKAPS